MKNGSKWKIIVSESFFLIIAILIFFVFINLSVKWTIRYLILILYILMGFLTSRFLKTWVLFSPILITLNIRWFINFETFSFPFSAIDILGFIYIIFLFYRFKNFKKMDEFNIPLFILLISILLSSINSFKPHFTLFTTAFFMLGYSYYKLLVDEIENQKELKIFIYLLFFCFLMNSVVAIFQYRGGFFLFGEEVSPTYEKGTLFPGGRVKGLFIHANSFAGILAIFSPFMLSFSLSNKISKKYRFYSLFTFIIVSISIFFSFSRNGYLTYLISCITLLLLFVYKQKRKTFFYIIGVLLVIVIINFSIFMLFPNIYERILSIFSYEYDPATRIRFFMWKKSLAKFAQSFLTGIGWGNFVFESYSFGLLIPHNLYINILLELGLLGAIAFIYFIYILFKKLFQLFYLSNSKNLYLTLPIISAWIGFFINNIADSIFTSPTHTIENKFFWILLALTSLSYRFSLQRE